MANSSSDDSCSAPTDFDISSNSELSNGRVTISYIRCPLCKKPKRIYYCSDCIRKGKFLHTSSRCSESFAEKKLRLYKMTGDKFLTLDQAQAMFEPTAREAALKSEITACHEKIRLLKLVIKETQESTLHVLTEIQRNEEDINERNIHITDNAECAKEKKRLLKRNSLAIYSERLEELKTCQSELKVVVRENITNLVQLIFPIRRVSTEQSPDDSSSEETISALADATRTSYIKGRWVYNDNSNDAQFMIVSSLLPGNGDYSAYNTWVESNESGPPTAASDLGHRHVACSISAALTYICQLVSILAFYLDIWLPKKLCYSEFCSHELSEQEFAYKVAKLNANVLHLCLSQNVNPDHLHPRHTASNIALLLDPNMCDLGRYGAFEVNAKIMESMEQSLFQDLETSHGSDDDSQEDADTFAEWETITEPTTVPPRVTMSAMPNIPITRTPHTTTETTATSVAGGLMSSAAASLASFWKAATGHK